MRNLPLPKSAKHIIPYSGNEVLYLGINDSVKKIIQIEGYEDIKTTDFFILNRPKRIYFAKIINSDSSAQDISLQFLYLFFNHDTAYVGLNILLSGNQPFIYEGVISNCTNHYFDKKYGKVKALNNRINNDIKYFLWSDEKGIVGYKYKSTMFELLKTELRN
jgi:hypothetical protein